MKILSFVALVFGGINWFCIGFLQYDIVAGFFGFQASIFSRLVYVAIGIATFNVVINIIKNKGKLVLWTKRSKKQKVQENEQSTQMQNNNLQSDFSKQNNLQHQSHSIYSKNGHQNNQFEQQTFFDDNSKNDYE